MASNLISLEEYKAYAGLNQINADEAITAILPKASALIKSFCRTSFLDYVNEDKIDYFNGGTNTLYLSEVPLIAIKSLEYSSDYGATYTELVEYTDYVIDVENACLRSLDGEYGFIFGINGYKATFNAGYESLPEDLKLATADLVTYYLKNDMAVHSPKAPGTNSVQIEYITTNNLPAHIARILNLYKKDFT